MADSANWQAHEDTLVACRRCERLVTWRERVAQERRRAYRGWDYWGKPVPGFGDRAGRILVIGLAPGAHGSNRTGRMFTGDASGEFLYAALYRAGFANQPAAVQRGDGLELKDVYISAVCRCAPPDNKPDGSEILACRPYLLAEMAMLEHIEGLVALGRIAFDQVLAIYKEQGAVVSGLEFKHGGLVSLGGKRPWLLGSYHPSRQNTQTGRLTVEMFDTIWLKCKDLLK